MGKFRQISTELRPLTDVRNCFLLSIFGIFLPIFFKFGIHVRVDIWEECLGIADDVRNWFSLSIFGFFFY